MARKRIWKKRHFTPAQKARRNETQRLRRQIPEVRARRNARNRAWMNAYYERQRPLLQARVRAYKTRNPEKVKASRRMHYELNKAEILARQKEYALRNRARTSARAADYYRRHAKRIRARVRDYLRRNPERARVWRHRRSARLAGAPGHFTATEFRELVTRHNGRCVYCGSMKDITPDHRIPLGRPELGPTNDISNILPACRTCNTRKGTKTEEEFRAWLRATDPTLRSKR